jgi:phosphatidylethanolamine/phosphatidyl-N-methylethanolamine N-methyltransferase
VAAVYEKLASVYDLAFGPALHPGRLRAIHQMDIQPGERVLEVGVGTGINLSLYRREAVVTGIDFSSSMLEKARERAARKGLRTMRLLQMDAADLKFADESFDIVYAPYLISVVPDPIKVAQEMRRVCNPGGRIIFLNHFLSQNQALSRIERQISPFTIHIGFKADLDLSAFLAQAGLEPVSIEKVNVPRIWSLVTCLKE